MNPFRWVRNATEYALGATLVLAHLALSGRLYALAEALDERPPRRKSSRYIN